MTWNNRIMRRRFPALRKGQPEQVLYGLHEVYYDENKKVDGWTKEAMFGYFETVEDLLATLKQMHTDAEKSKADVLDYHADEKKRGKK